MSSFSHQCHLQILHISLQDKISPSTATPSRLCSSGQSHHQNSSPLDWLPGCRHSMFKSTGPESRGKLFFVYNQTKSKKSARWKALAFAILDTWTKDFCRVTPGRGDVMTCRSWSPNWMKYDEIPPTARVTFSTSGWTKRHALELIGHGDTWMFLPIERCSDQLQHKIWASSTTSHSTRACSAKLLGWLGMDEKMGATLPGKATCFFVP